MNNPTLESMNQKRCQLWTTPKRNTGIVMIIMYNVISDWQSNGEVLCLACGVLCTRAQTLQRLNAVCHNPPTSSNKQLWEIQNNKRKLRRGLELWISKQGRRHLLQGENSSSTASELSWNLNQKTARCDTIIIVALSEARPYQLGSHPHDHSYRFTRSEFSIQRCGWYKKKKWSTTLINRVSIKFSSLPTSTS